MKILSQELAMAIYNCHAEIKRGKELLKEVEEFLAKPDKNPLEDVFGRQHSNLEMAIPSGSGSKSIVRVSPELGKHVIIAHLARMEADLKELSQSALVSLESK